MSYDYPPRNPMSRASKMRGSQAPERERDNSSAMQMSRAQQQQLLTGCVAILWDMENCPVPSEVKADDVAGNIRMALRLHPVIQGGVTFFSAYGDFNHFPKKVREGCQRTGVNLIDVPNGKKDASDKAILVDLFLFALDNAPPCTIFLISGDVDFAPALHKLGQRGYTVVLAIPSGVGVSGALCSAGRFVWDWPSVARGGGLVPAKNFSSRGNVDDRMAEIIEMNVYTGQAGPAWSPSDDSDLASDDPVPVEEEEQIVWKSSAPHRNVVDHAVADGSGGSKLDVVAPRGSGSSSSRRPPPGVYPAVVREVGNLATGVREMSGSGRAQADATGSSAGKGSSQNPMQTGNLQALKEQLVRLLSSHGNKLELARLLDEYQKQYGRPLYLSEYGHSGTKLVSLLERFREFLFMRGEGVNKTLHLTKPGSRLAAKLKRDAKNNRSMPKEEEEVVDCFRIQVEELGHGEDQAAGPAPKVRRDAKNGRGAPKEEEEVIDCFRVQAEDPGHAEAETAGPAAKVRRDTKNGRGVPKEEEEVIDCFRIQTVDPGHAEVETAGLAAEVRPDAKNGRGVPKEEEGVIDCFRIQIEDLGITVDETAGEHVLATRAKQNVQQTLVEEDEPLLIGLGSPQKSEREITKGLEEIQVPVYDWGFGSGGSGGKDRQRSEGEIMKDLEEIQVPPFDWGFGSGGSSGKDRQRSEGEIMKDLEEIQVPAYDWGFGSGASVGKDSQKTEAEVTKDLEEIQVRAYDWRFGASGGSVGNEPQKIEGKIIEDLQEIQVPVYDWGFGSGGSSGSGSGDEKDNDPAKVKEEKDDINPQEEIEEKHDDNPQEEKDDSDAQEEKDVEVDESTLQPVVKNEGKRTATGSDILDVFRRELQELLVSYACKIEMTRFLELYEQRYSRGLDYAKFGVQDLESLIEKVDDIAVMMEEPGSHVKFMVAS